jgi:hypothetical protein
MAKPPQAIRFCHDTPQDSAWCRGGASNILGQGPIEIGEFTSDLNRPEPDAISFSADALLKTS